MAIFTRIRDQVLTVFGDNWLVAQEYLTGPKSEEVSQMRVLPALILIIFLLGCDSGVKVTTLGETSESQARTIDQDRTEIDPLETDSFRISNKEIRDEMLEFFEKDNIWYSLSDDNLITIFLIDGDKVDKIYTDVRLTYIRRN
jgi:hypothetical protein